MACSILVLIISESLTRTLCYLGFCLAEAIMLMQYSALRISVTRHVNHVIPLASLQLNDDRLHLGTAANKRPKAAYQ